MWYYFDQSTKRYLGYADDSNDILSEHITKQESDLVFTDAISENPRDHDIYDWYLGDDGATVTRVDMPNDPPEE